MLFKLATSRKCVNIFLASPPDADNYGVSRTDLLAGAAVDTIGRSGGQALAV